MQIIIILEIFKDFFPCKVVLDPNQQYPENIQRLFCLQNCLRSKSSLSWKYSKMFPPAKLSQPQIIFILKIFKDFSPCKSVLSSNHHYLENIQRIFSGKIVLAANLLYPENIQRLFSCKIVLDANHHYPGNIQRLFHLQSCLISKSAISWKYSKTFSPAELS